MNATHLRTQGFTLIELLVVVAIIVTLLAILLPSMGRAIAISESAVCKSNLKQFHTASLAYTADHRGQIPAANYWAAYYGDSNPHDNWKQDWSVPAGVLYKYVGQQDSIYVCPTFAGVFNAFGNNAGATPAYSYSVNAYTQIGGWGPFASIRTLSQIRRPASLFYFTEENAWVVSGKYVSPLNDPKLAPSWANDMFNHLDAFATFHLPPDGDLNNGFANAAFFDGHVEQVEFKDCIDLGTPLQYRP